MSKPIPEYLVEMSQTEAGRKALREEMVAVKEAMLCLEELLYQRSAEADIEAALVVPAAPPVPVLAPPVRVLGLPAPVLAVKDAPALVEAGPSSPPLPTATVLPFRDKSAPKKAAQADGGMTAAAVIDSLQGSKARIDGIFTVYFTTDGGTGVGFSAGLSSARLAIVAQLAMALSVSAGSRAIHGAGSVA